MMRRMLLRRRRDADHPLVRGRLARSVGKQLTWDIQSGGHLAVVVVNGELDAGTAPGLGRQLEPLADAGRLLVLDLAGLRFCDCAGLNLFLRLQQRVANRPIIVLWPWLTRFARLAFASGRSGSLTLDVAKMYCENIAPDPGSMPRGYGGSSAGAGVFGIWLVRLEGYLPEKGGNPQEIPSPCAICHTGPATRTSIRH